MNVPTNRSEHRNERGWQFAPPGYRQEWQFSPRSSGLPIGYFSPSYRGWGRIIAGAVAVVLMLMVVVR